MISGLLPSQLVLAIARGRRDLAALVPLKGSTQYLRDRTTVPNVDIGSKAHWPRRPASLRWAQRDTGIDIRTLSAVSWRAIEQCPRFLVI